MDEFTGINIERAVNDISTFNNKCWEIQAAIRFPLKELFLFLSKHWASPIAKDFSDKIGDRWLEIDSDYITNFKHIVSGAEEAAQSLARANGTNYPQTGLNMEPGQTMPGDPIPALSDSLNGTTGMDVEGVRNNLGIFKTKIKSALEQFNDLPDGIAFYDPNGDMIGSYSRNIKEFKSTFENLINDIITAIESYLETEADNILLAKQQAIDTMNA